MMTGQKLFEDHHLHGKNYDGYFKSTTSAYTEYYLGPDADTLTVQFAAEVQEADPSVGIPDWDIGEIFLFDEEGEPSVYLDALLIVWPELGESIKQTAYEKVWRAKSQARREEEDWEPRL